MSDRHPEEIDRAVLLARKAAVGGRIDDHDKLTRFLYRNWFLGRRPAAPTPRKPVPQQRRQPQLSTRPGPTGPSSTGPSSTGPFPAGPVPTAPVATRPVQPWRTWGRLWTEDRACRGADLVRLYLSCAPHTSLHAVAAVTAAARDWDHPWLLTSRAPHLPVPGPDATVLYLPVAALPELREPVGRLLEELSPFLGSTVPALTLEIGRGAALAQNPADGRSFGVHRCSIVAATVLSHLHHPHPQVIDRTLVAFRNAGVDPQHPHRALGARWEWDTRARAA